MVMLAVFDLLGDNHLLKKNYWLMNCFESEYGYQYLFKGFTYMRLRWLILFFLLGAVGVILLQLTACSPSETASAPLVEKAPSVYASSSASPAASTSAAARAIDKEIVKLPQGEAYQNVPEKMQVGVAETIEAGITPQVTEKIKKELQGNGTINTQAGVHYDPAGVEMKLGVQSDEFKVSEVKGGKQFVTANVPGKWLWRVTPLKKEII